MAGVKGRSGGARPNSGPKKRPPAVTQAKDALEFLHQVMRGKILPTVVQLDAAKAICRHTLAPPTAGGKKDERAEAAKKAATGRFAAAAPPLKLVNKA